MTPPALAVERLSIAIDGAVVVENLSFSVDAGRVLALVGESGCGKSLTARALMRLLPDAARQVGGHVALAGEDIAALPERRMRRLRGRRIAMIFQEPQAALDPLARVGAQVAEAAGRPGRAVLRRAFEDVGIADPARRIGQYPFELSGGMCQRVMIAAALVGNPAVLVADEPTTALDVTIQAQILDLLRALAARGTAIVLITHDMGVVADIADHVAVMYAGRIAETGTAEAVFARPRHPYTALLLAALPRLHDAPKSALATIEGSVPAPGDYGAGCRFAGRCPLADVQCVAQPPLREVASGQFSACWHAERLDGHGRPPLDPAQGGALRIPLPRSESPALSITDVAVHFPVRGGPPVRAVDGVSLTVEAGETVGLVGESGCGKSTPSNAVVGLVSPTSGSIRVQGIELGGADRHTLRRVRAEAQMVFQDPAGSLNPRMTVGEAIGEPLLVRGLARGAALRAQVAGLLEEVGLRAEHARRYPHQFSGGQRQRVVIARALALRPALLVCDEPVSALDISVRAQILNLLVALQRAHGMACLFVSHDLAVVRHVCDRVAVMYLGHLVELAPRAALYAVPRHPYTRALLDAVPEPDPAAQRAKRLVKLQGEIPSPTDPPAGCVFHTRCPLAIDLCRAARPEWRRVGSSMVACHRAELTSPSAS